MPRNLRQGVAITDLEQGSPAWLHGLRPGDRITRIAHRAIEDALAATFAMGSASAPVTLTLIRDGRRRRFEITDPDAFLQGMSLEQLETRTCTNDCVYCFCKQNPPTARPALFFRDEDYRMSFLTGNYLTLSALTDKDLLRIVNDRLQPLYVTVPSTDEALRRFMLGVRRARPLMATLWELVSSGISVHAQIVVCPGLNDAAELDRTLADLASLRPGLASVALVPVGITRFTADPRIRRPFAAELREMVAAAGRWRLSPPPAPPWAHVSDEIYLSLGIRVPPQRAYGDGPQLATGVGMVRQFVDDAGRVRRRKVPAWWRSHRIALVTGELFAPVLSRVLDSLNERWGRNALLIPVENRYFGSSVTVAGLLGGAEISDRIRNLGVDAVVVPADSLANTARFIDDVDLSAVQRAAGVPITAADVLSEAMAKVGAVLA